MEIDPDDDDDETVAACNPMIVASSDAVAERMAREQEDAKTERIRRFYFGKPVSDAELAAVGPEIEANLLEAIQRLEKHGVAALQEAKQQDEKLRAERQRRRQQLEQETLEAAAINGEARNYQMALFELAKKENIIVHLGTGMGKTLIAIMLIQHVMNHAEDKSKDNDGALRKQTLFLVPSVALAFQQQLVLQANLPGLRAGRASESTILGKDSRQNLSEADVIVGTHGAVLELLLHYGDLFRMERFQLLVIDECHHCIGNSDHAKLMKEFYHKLPNDGSRPRVLGLTASPLINIKTNITDAQLEDKLRELESTVDARIVSPSQLGLEPASDKDVDINVVEYDHAQAGLYNPLPLMPENELNKARRKDFRQLYTIYPDLGPFLVGSYCQQLRDTLAPSHFDCESDEEFRKALKFLEDIKAHCDVQVETDTVHSGRSSKVKALEDLLLKRVDEKPDSVGIVFVAMRLTALILNHYIKERYEASNIATTEGTKATKPPLFHVDIPCDMSSITCTNSWDERPFLMQQGDPMLVDTDTGSPFDDAEDDPFATYFATSAADPVQNQPRTCIEPILPSDDMDDQFADADSVEDTTRSAFHAATTHSTNGSSALARVSDMQITDGDLNGNAKDLKQLTTQKKFVGIPLRSDVLVRQQTKSSKAFKRQLTEQEENMIQKADCANESRLKRVLNHLRQGDVNILFATSVVEEGVDIRNCSFIIVFDQINSTKSYVQMKGRARQLHSQFFAFENPSLQQMQSFEDARAMEKRLQEHLCRRPSPLRLQSDVADVPSSVYDDAELQAVKQGYYKAKHATVLISGAKSLLYRYMSSVPLDSGVRSSRSSFEAHMPSFDSIKRQMLLPAHISPRSRRIVALPECCLGLRKRDMEKALCLMSCVRLHKLGLLDDRLLPISKEFLRDIVLKPLRQVKGRTARSDSDPQTRADKCGVIDIFIYRIIQSNEVFRQYRAALCISPVDLAIVTLAPLEQALDSISLMVEHTQFGTMVIRFGSEQKASCTPVQMETLSNFFQTVFSARWKANGTYQRRSGTNRRGSLADYTVGCVDIDGELLFPYMGTIVAESNRTKAQRAETVRRASLSTRLPSPRMWQALYDSNTRLVVFGPTGECADATVSKHLKEKHPSIQTYRDFYRLSKNVEVDYSSPLFDAQFVWNFPRQPGITGTDCEMDVDQQISASDEKSSCKCLPKLKIPLCQFEERPGVADAGIALLSTFLPQVLYQLETIVTASSFRVFCISQLPTLGRALSASPIDEVAAILTAKTCAEEYSYERLEWLGDAVLKLIHTDCIIKSIRLADRIQCLHEGHLDLMRSALGENKRFEEVCIALGIDRFVMTMPLSRGIWTPAPLELVTDKEADSRQSSQPRGKLLADVIEAIVGFVYLKAGYGEASAVAIEMQASIPYNNDTEGHTSEDYGGTWTLIGHIEALTGYRFDCCGHLAQEALTHPTYVDARTPSYQKLEWIGDAVLCLAIRNWVFHHFPNFEVGAMVNIESALVSNESLGFLSHESGLSRYIIHCDSTLPGRIDDYVFALSMDDRGLWGTDPPKCIADIMEAVLGAIHVHAGFQNGMEAALHVLRPVLNLLEATQNNVHGSIILLHPKTSLMQLVGELVSIHTETGNLLSTTTRDCMWTENGSRNAQRSNQGSISTIKCAGVDLLLICDKSPAVAANHACALVLAVLELRPELVGRLKAIRAKLKCGAMNGQPSI